MSNKATINSPPQGRTVAVVGDVYRFLATGEDTNGKYAVWAGRLQSREWPFKVLTQCELLTSGRTP
jgi:hypothetical protein